MQRNEIPIPNSRSKCLIENWVEERATKNFDPDATNLPAGYTSKLQLIKGGHAGIISTEQANFEKNTTYSTDYRKKDIDTKAKVGAKKQMLLQFYYEKATNGMSNEYDETLAPTCDYITEFSGSFFREFDSSKPAPTMNHSIEREQPVTFWTDHSKNIHGRSQVKTGDTPFRKNTSFSKPISEYFDQTVPYDFENYPKT